MLSENINVEEPMKLINSLQFPHCEEQNTVDSESYQLGLSL